MVTDLALNGKQLTPLIVKISTIVIAKSTNIQELDAFKYQILKTLTPYRNPYLTKAFPVRIAKFQQ